MKKISGLLVLVILFNFNVFSNISKYKSYISKGMKYYKAKKYKKALNVFIDAIRYRPDLAEGFYDAACMSSLLNNKKIALFYLEQTFIRNTAWKRKAKIDSDFNNIRKTKEFKKLMKRKKFEVIEGFTRVPPDYLVMLDEINYEDYSEYISHNGSFSIKNDKIKFLPNNKFIRKDGPGYDNIRFNLHGVYRIIGRSIKFYYKLRVTLRHPGTLGGPNDRGVPEHRERINTTQTGVLIGLTPTITKGIAFY